MPDMKTILSALGAAIIACAPLAAQKTTILTPDQYNGYGVVYTLPTTALEIDITARHTLRTAGPFYQYAKKQLGASKIVENSQESWEITNITVRPYGVANDSVQYRMQLKAGQNLQLAVADNGMLLAVNATPDADAISSPINNPAPLTPPDGDAYLQYVTEDFLSSQSSAKRAQMLAESILEVRDARLSLTRGTAETMPTDGRQLELMLNSLQHQEQLMTEAFCGTEQSQTYTTRYTFIPFEEGKYVLARLGDYSGFVEPDNLAGAPIYVQVVPISVGEVPLDEKGNPRQAPKEGIVYCVPGSAQITISFQGRNFYNAEIPLAQLGTTFALDPSLFIAKKSPSFATFSPITGALKEIGTK